MLQMTTKNTAALALIGKGRWGNIILTEASNIEKCEIKYTKTHDYKELLSYEDIDGIIIATPAETHAEIISAFPNHFLLVEKPLTTNLKDAKAIKNKNIMVGHTYLYNVLLMRNIKKIGKILKIDFILHNTDSYGSKVGPIWELAPHPVSLFLYFAKESVNIDYAKMINGNLTAKLSSTHCICNMSVGWNYKKRKRQILVVGEKGKVDVMTLSNKISPLENEIRSFAKFIRGGASKTPLEEGVKVVELLSEIEKNV